jgi:exopolyphosphatase/guanosine-5'-triphosphate,3'-diphosphate pyrophosphatase
MGRQHHVSEPITLAAIDAGSNALRINISTASSASELAVVEAERVPVRLGHGTFHFGELDKATIESAVSAFARFRKLFDQHGVDRYRAVATSALRNARNREDLIDRVYREVGLELEVIDGEEEARLVRKAVLHAYGDREPPGLIVDLGGGSLEITSKVKDQWNTASMRIGTVRLLETFGLSGAISDDEARMIRRFVGSTLHQSLSEGAVAVDVGFGAACGGNAEALGQLFGSTDKRGMLTLKIAALEEALPKILGSTLEERMEKFGVKRDRADVMGVAALVFATVGKELKLKRYHVPCVGIREGVLLDLAGAMVGELARGTDPPAVAAARVFAARLGHATTHGEQVRRIARGLFDQLQELHKLPRSAGEALELAALLHDIGEVVHRQSHHKHSEYLIRSGRIPGLESPQREIVAAVARAHRKGTPDPKRHPTYAELGESDQRLVRQLAAILRVADGLDTDHRQRIVAVSATVKSDHIALTVSLERDELATPPTGIRKTAVFEQEFGHKVQCEVVEVAPRPRTPPSRFE